MDNRLRPRYHFAPPANWMNDPNGLIHWQGVYHLFYQHNPEQPLWGLMHWGHATSTDLVHWSHQPIALVPDPDGPDRDGCFSGVAVNTGEGVALMYTGVQGEKQLPCLAKNADDDLTAWVKYPGNPVISAPPEGIETTMYRDHSVWKEGDTWFQVVGSGIAGKGGAAMLYRSPDLIEWEFLHPLLVEQPEVIAPEWRTLGWECPDFVTLGDRHVLMVSLWGLELSGIGYYAGTYDHHHFTPDQYGLVDGGRSFYAPQSFTDASGRRIMFGWLRETCSDARLLERGWAGAMSLPRVLGMHEDGALKQTIASEVKTLRGRQIHLDWTAVDWFRDIDLRGIPGNQLEIEAEFTPGDDTLLAFSFCGADDDSERTVISVTARDSEFRLDTSHSSHDPDATGADDRMSVTLDPGAPVRLHIFVDVSIIEVILNDRYCLTARIYPVNNDDLRLHISSTVDGTIDIWEMATSVHPSPVAAG